MGAWGYGLRANDTAQDAIGYCNDRQIFKYILNGTITVDQAFKNLFKVSWIKNSPEAILGIVDEMLDYEIDFRKFYISGLIGDKINQAYEKLLDPKDITTYTNPKLRKKAVIRFGNRYYNNENSRIIQKQVNKENLGLFPTLARIFRRDRFKKVKLSCKGKKCYARKKCEHEPIRYGDIWGARWKFITDKDRGLDEYPFIRLVSKKNKDIARILVGNKLGVMLAEYICALHNHNAEMGHMIKRCKNIKGNVRKEPR